MAEPDEQQRASKVDAKCPGASEREGQRSRRHGVANLCQAVHSVASTTSRMAASAIPSRARLSAVQPKAITIRRLSEASSRKSTLSAKSDTEPIAKATANLTPK